MILRTDQQLDNWLASAHRPLVFTNGCFDILHRGHVDILQRSAEYGETLLVALNSDKSVKRLGKGDDRPLNTLEDRMAVIEALACVGAVCAFDEDTPLQRIEQCKPDVLIKGGDWAPKNMIGAEQVKSWGGQCHSIAFNFDRSTTALINKIRL